MKHTLCRAKIHRAMVTDGNLEYPGSITIGRNMLEASGIVPFELVHVNSVTTGNHWETYVIPGEDGEIILNGAPAHHFKCDDIVVIMAFAELTPGELADFSQRVVYVENVYQYWPRYPILNKVSKIEDKHMKDYV